MDLKSHRLPLSKKWVEVNHREEEQKKLEKIKEKQIFRLEEKRKYYGKEVKINHWPEISKKKQEEVIERKLHMNTISRRGKSSTTYVSGSLKPSTGRVSRSIVMSNIKQEGIDQQLSLPNYKKYRVSVYTLFSSVQTSKEQDSE